MDCNNNNCNLITIKVTLLSTKGEVKEHRRFSFARSALCINALYEAIGLPVVLHYTDCEGDSIAVRTQADLDEMLRTRTPGEPLIRMHATVARSTSSSVSKAVKPAMRAVQRMAEPHIETAKNLADSAVESAKCAALVGEQEAKAAAVSTAEAIKKVAEEAIVLGVRGYSIAYDRMYPGLPDEINNAPKKEEPQPEPQPEPVSPPLSSEFVKIEPPAPEPVPAAPTPAVVVVPSPQEAQMQVLLKELALMGFKDEEVNRALLEKNQMSIAATVAMLLDGE